MASILQNFMNSVITDDIKHKLSERANTGDLKTTNMGINAALTALLSGMQENVATEKGKKALDETLAKKHGNGTVAGNVLAALDNPATQQDGSKIIGHIFGNKKDDVLDQVSKKTGIDKNGMIALMVALAPVVISKLGQMKKQQGLDKEAVADVVNQVSVQDTGIGGKVVDMLDQDGDGSVIDDVVDMAKKAFGGKK